MMTYNRLSIGGLLFCVMMSGACKEKAQLSPSSQTSAKDFVKAKKAEPIIIEVEAAPILPIPAEPVLEAAPLPSPAPNLTPVLPSLPFLPPPPPLGLLVPPPIDDDDHECEEDECSLGSASFSVTNSDLWYQIDTFGAPDSRPLSINRNHGNTKGGVALNPNGLTVESPGSYWASFTVNIQYVPAEPDPGYTPLFVIFLVKDGEFDPLDFSSQLGTAESVPTGVIMNIQSNGLLVDLEEDTKLSLVIMNGGSPSPEPATIIAWGISLYKICD